MQARINYLDRIKIKVYIIDKEPPLHLMTWNHKTYIQETNGQVTDLGGLIEDLGPLNHYYTPPTNTTQATCKHCGTTYKPQYSKQGRCPFCNRLI
jgi:hypothetical protein